MKPYYGGRPLTTEGRATCIALTQCLHRVLSQAVATAVHGDRRADEMHQALNYLEASVKKDRIHREDARMSG